MTDMHHILVTLSEEFDSTIISSGNFYIFDSTANKSSNLKYAYKGDTKKEELVLVTDQEFNQGSNYFVFAKQLKDKKGNTFENEGVSLTVSDRVDTTKPSISYAVPASGSTDADFQNQSFYFRLNDAVDSTALTSRISFTDTLKKSISYTIQFIDNASFRIYPAGLEPGIQYIIKVNLPGITDAAGNSADSAYIYKFKTISGLDFTGISGIINNVDIARNPVLILEGTKDNREKYLYKAEGRKFEIKRVRPGSYIFWGFYDEDKNGEYSYGSYNPFKYAEEFSVYPDSVNLRPRWTVTDVKFNFGNP